MSPTCSSRLFVGRKTRSAAARTTQLPPGRSVRSPKPVATDYEAYAMFPNPARGNPARRRAWASMVCSPGFGGEEDRYGRARRPGVPGRVRRRGAPGRERARGELQGRGHAPVLPQAAAARAGVRARGRRAQRRRGDDPERRGHRAWLQLRRRLRRGSASCRTRAARRFAVNGVNVDIGGFPEVKDATPKGCDTAYVDTWACGPLKPGREKTFRWSVTAVKAGPFKLDWRVAAGLNGKARAVSVSGGEAVGGTVTGNVLQAAAAGQDRRGRQDRRRKPTSRASGPRLPASSCSRRS